MKNHNRILYVIIGILLGANLIQGGMFHLYSQKIKEMEIQTESMKKEVDDTLALADNQETAEDIAIDGDVDEDYVDVDQDTDETNENTEDIPQGEGELTPSDNTEENGSIVDFSGFQTEVSQLVSGYQQQTGGTWSVYVEDLDSGESLVVNEAQMQAASLIKLYIMGAVYEHYDELTATGNDIDSLLYSMITVSDNDSANSLVGLLGGGDNSAGRSVVNTFCQENGYSSTQMGRMLLEDNASGDNYTSVTDCGKFLRTVYNGGFSYSEQMLSLLKQQTRLNKIPAGIPDDVITANKTGELSNVENDVAIVYGDKMPYVICVMTQDIGNSQTTVDGIGKLSNAIYGRTNQL